MRTRRFNRSNYNMSVGRRPSNKGKIPRGTARVFFSPLAGRWVIDAAYFEPKSDREMFHFLLKNGCDAEFDPDAKMWTVSEEQLEKTKALLNETYDSVRVEPKPPPRTRATQPFMPPTPEPALPDFIRLVGSTPANLAEAKRLYYRTAMRLHPDQGGTDEQMRELNLAYTAAQRELSH